MRCYERHGDKLTICHLGFAQAFATSVNWQYTFFAPSNTAFNNTGQYYNEFAGTPKGQWWVGQMLQHHYIPNSILYAANFTEEKTRVQSGSYLFLGTQLVDGDLVLNNAATVVDKDLPVTNVSAYSLTEKQRVRGLPGIGHCSCDRSHPSRRCYDI